MKTDKEFIITDTPLKLTPFAPNLDLDKLPEAYSRLTDEHLRFLFCTLLLQRGESDTITHNVDYIIDFIRGKF
jgi:hypothetical protein